MKIRKIFAVIIILTMCLLLLSSCIPSSTPSDSMQGTTTNTAIPTTTPSAVPTQAPPTVDTFIVINSKKIFDNTTQYIMYDPETMVMWSALYSSDSSIYSRGTGLGIGISHTPMYNADGTLRLYNPEME